MQGTQIWMVRRIAQFLEHELVELLQLLFYEIVAQNIPYFFII